LHLLKQPRVLDGDDGLVGEGLQQFNLSVGKWAHFRATQGNCPDSFASANKGAGQHGMVAKTPCDRTAPWIVVRLRLHIGEVDRLPVEDCTPGDTSTRQWHSGYPADRGNVLAARNYAEQVAVPLYDSRVIGVAETCC